MNTRTEAAGEMDIEVTAHDFEAVFRAQYECVARAIDRLVRDPARAEELAVEVFFRLWRTPPSHEANIAGWLHRTAVRIALDELRGQSRRRRYERLLQWFSPASSPERIYSVNEEQQRVQSVLASMNRRQAELLVLRNDGASYQQIADMHALNPSSIGTLLARSQEAFRREYTKRYGA